MSDDIHSFPIYTCKRFTLFFIFADVVFLQTSLMKMQRRNIINDLNRTLKNGTGNWKLLFELIWYMDSKYVIIHMMVHFSSISQWDKPSTSLRARIRNAFLSLTTKTGFFQSGLLKLIIFLTQKNVNALWHSSWLQNVMIPLSLLFLGICSFSSWDMLFLIGKKK